MMSGVSVVVGGFCAVDRCFFSRPSGLLRVVPGRAFDLEGIPSRGVRLSLTRANVHEIEAGVRVLGECAADLLQLQTAAQPFV